MLATIRPRTGAEVCLLQGFGQGGNDGDRPGFVGQSQRRLEPALVEQRIDQLGLVPGLEPPDGLTNRPGRERIGIAERLVKCRKGRGVSQPSQSDGGFTPNGRIAIAQSVNQGGRDGLVLANARRASGLKSNPRRWVVQHGADRLPRFRAADRVERPEGVKPAGFGFGGVQPIDERLHGRLPRCESGFAATPCGPKARGDRAP